MYKRTDTNDNRLVARTDGRLVVDPWARSVRKSCSSLPITVTLPFYPVNEVGASSRGYDTVATRNVAEVKNQRGVGVYYDDNTYDATPRYRVHSGRREIQEKNTSVSWGRSASIGYDRGHADDIM